MMSVKEQDRQAVTALRMLAVDMVEQAGSGHPGMPLGAAPMAWVLWSRVLRHNPSNPQWPDRDRFILSAGHGSALLYALLYLTGYALSQEDLRAFRQWGSLTPGHPEYGHPLGVECTTGPLGQGFAMGVGMAIAEMQLAEQINSVALLPVIDHYVYAIVSDGDLMEGVASEAASMAGHMRLGKLIYLYDNNGITIEGGTELSFGEDVRRRFEAYGWQVLQVEDGEDLDEIELMLHKARMEKNRPSLVMVRTVIGRGSPKAGSPAAHGAPLGPAGVARTREFYGWTHEPFHVPEVLLAHCREMSTRGREVEAEWRSRVAGMRTNFPGDVDRLLARLADPLLDGGWRTVLEGFAFEERPVATRTVSGQVLNALAPVLPTLMGGSADLAPSNMTWLRDTVTGPGGVGARNLHFGVREHAMAAVSNGIALHGGFVSYCGTFLVFSDYMRGAMRLSAMMGARVIYVLTHDSVAVGEDGPTHQPIEQIASLRAMPDMVVIRPADARETVAAWGVALEREGPTVLVLSRQNLPLLSGSVPDGVSRGAYIVSEAAAGHAMDMILIATGSEVHPALAAQQILRDEGINARVVSMPSWELFAAQPAEWREHVLPSGVKNRLAIEAASSFGWGRWTGDESAVVGINHYGASAPGDRLLTEFGFTAERIAWRALSLFSHRNAV